MFFKRHKKTFITLGTAIGTAALMYQIWGTVFILFSFFVVFMHELGHKLAAQLSGADVGHMFFVPLIFAMVGATQITNIPTNKEPLVALAGPAVGIISALLIYGLVILFGLTNLTIPCLLLLVFEIANLFIGSDAKRYRAAKRKKKLEYEFTLW